MQTPDYYGTLEIERSATAEEIKQAYRKQAKRHHPDKNPGKEKYAERMFRRICIAYEILSNPQRKLKYDLMLRAVDGERGQPSRHFEELRKSKQTRHKYQLMFQELLNENVEAGLQIYEQLQRETEKCCIDDFLNYEDSRDCECLVAEAYQTLGDYRTAMAIYESLIESEKRRPCFHHFIHEIKERLKQSYFHFFTNPQNLEDIPTGLEKIRALNLSKRETARIYKKLSECYINVNKIDQAKEILRMAFELYPGMTGAKKVCQQLGMEHFLNS